MILVLFVFVTENGYIQKAVNYDGEMFIVEEIQLYENPEPITVLRLSPSEVLYNNRPLMFYYV